MGDSEEIDNQIEVEPKRENEIEKEDKLDIEQSPTENLDFVEEMELLDEPITKLSPKERFLGLGQTFSSLSKEYASKIWHERKRLRLKRRGELKDLQESLPQEKKAKFKPRRQDFSLELLCGNNLFDNIIIESSAVLKEVESALYLASKSSRFVRQKKLKYKMVNSSNEMVLSIRRMKSPKYLAKVVSDTKIVFYRKDLAKTNQQSDSNPITSSDIDIVEKKEESEEHEKANDKMALDEKDEDSISPRTLTSILKKGKSSFNSKGLDFFGKTKSQKSTPQRKFKVSKVTWGPVPSKAKKPPKKVKTKSPDAEQKRANKENSETNTEEAKVPKKRGRKPKPKPSLNPSDKISKEVVGTEKKKRGRKPKIKVPQEISTNEQEIVQNTETKNSEPIQSAPDQNLNEVDSSKAKAIKRSRKGRPRKLTEEDVAKCQQLDIQLIEDDRSSDQTLQKIIQSETSKKLGSDFSGSNDDNGLFQKLSLKSDLNFGKSDNIFDFDDDDDKNDTTFVSHTSIRDYNLQSIVKKSKPNSTVNDISPPKKRKIKRCQFSGESGDEQQVP